MKFHLFCYINKKSVEEAKQIATRCHAKIINDNLEIVSKEIFSNKKFNVLDNFDFVSMEFVLENMFDLNKFCYQLYMSCGYHFFIENIISLS